jgi:hypothetical protein
MSATSRRTRHGNRSIIGRVVNPKGLGVPAPPRRAKPQLLPGANARVLVGSVWEATMGTDKPNGRKGAVRKRSQRKAAKMAGREIDRLGDQAATSEERAKCKRRLIKGPREFRDLRGDLPKTKS